MARKPTQSTHSVNTVRIGEERRADGRFEEIIGNSTGLKFVLSEVQRVAPTDSTVLVLGETGSGKECVATAIHKASTRRDRPFIKLNCAAIPFDLLESELFGYEKGAFTGAFAQKSGRFEMADTGTLFLGDIPLALQPKLLRVLQEKEFERLGSGKTHHVDVRLVVATHRNLEEMIVRKQFRSDLYSRLNVFPIVLPPLRERREDNPLLVSRFVEVFSRRMGKQITSIPSETLDAFTSYSWPGNVRELQNLVERAVILSNDEELANLLPTQDSNSATVTAVQGRFWVTIPDFASFASRRVDHRGTTWRGQAVGTETNYVNCQNEKARYLATEARRR